MSSTHVGNRIGGTSVAPKGARTVRRCAEETCSTRLSRYNSSDRCFAHTPPRFPRIRGKVVESAS